MMNLLVDTPPSSIAAGSGGRGRPYHHVRRKFYELHVGGINSAATASVKAMAELWKVEDEIRGKDANIRAAARTQRSATIVASLFEIWEKELAKVSGKSKTAEAIRYAMNRRQSLERFLTDGRIEIDSNIVERAIRPQTIIRKNSLFAGSEGGGNTWATIATLLQTYAFGQDRSFKTSSVNGASIWRQARRHFF